MRLFFQKRAAGRIEFGAIYGGIALLALAAARFLPVLAFLPSCPFQELTGAPCPACGSSRSVVHLAHGDIATSIALNPLTSISFLAALLYFLYSLITLAFGAPGIGLHLTEKEKNAVRAGAVLIVLANWIYLLFVL